MSIKEVINKYVINDQNYELLVCGRFNHSWPIRNIAGFQTY